MLYNVDLLRKDGRFGVLWHLGSTGSTSSNVSKKLKRKLVDRVVVRRMCEEVADLLPLSKQHVSLSMASTLMLGLLKCHSLQAEFLLKDILGSKRRRQHCQKSIDLPQISRSGIADMMEAIEGGQTSDEEGALAAPKAALVKRMVNIRQITMVETDLFQRQDFDDQGFGQLDMDASGDIRTYLEDGDLFAVVNETVQAARGANEEEEAPGAPKRERRPQPRADNEVTDAGLDGFDAGLGGFDDPVPEVTEMETDEVPAIPKISQTIVSLNLGADQHNVASPRLEVEQDLGDGDDQQMDQAGLDGLNAGLDGFDVGLGGFDAGLGGFDASVPDQANVDQVDQGMTEVHDDIQDQGAPQPEQEISPSLDPNQPFNLAEVETEEPRVPPRGRKRPLVNVAAGGPKRKLKMDFQIQLSVQNLMDNFESYDSSMVRPHELPHQQKLKENLLSRPMRDVISSTLSTDFQLIGNAIILQDDDEVPQIEDNSEEDVSHLRDGSVVVSEGRFSVVDVAGTSAVAVDKDDQEFEIRDQPNFDDQGEPAYDDQGQPNFDDQGGLFDAPFDMAEERSQPVLDVSPPVLNGSPPVLNGSPPVLNGSPPVLNGSPPVLNVSAPVLDFTIQSPPLSNSTLRQDAADWPSFEVKLDSEKERVMKIVRNAPTRQTFFETILKSDGEEGPHEISRRHAAIAFSALLFLQAERKVNLTQNEFWGPINVELRSD